MDFEHVIKTLLAEFERRQIRYSIIGGFAVGALGVLRATRDIDFLVHRDDLPRLDELLTGLGYQRIARTENVSHYAHADPKWGALDFLHAFREISLEMLARAKTISIFEGSVPARIAEPEDVVGFKVQAMANNPRRRSRELADIEQLLELYGKNIDWARVEQFFTLFELQEDFRELKGRFGYAQ